MESKRSSGSGAGRRGTAGQRGDSGLRRRPSERSEAERTARAGSSPRQRSSAARPRRDAEGRPQRTGARGQQRPTSRTAPAQRSPEAQARARERARQVAEQKQARRRLIIRLLLIIAAIALVIVLVVVSTKLVRDSLAQVEVNTSAPNPADEFREVQCTSEMLDFSSAYSGRAAGDPVNFTATLSNTDPKHPCFIDAGYDHVKVIVTSGEETIWDSQKCALGNQQEMLLIGSKQETQISAMWDGIVSGPDCTGTREAQPGTYHARFYWDNKEVTDDMVFELIAKPASDSE